MNKAKKTVLTVLMALLLVVTSVAGTIAYLTAKSEKVTNTFTVGKVAITLDENEVKFNNDGGDKYINDGNKRVTSNEYTRLLPGDIVAKDPTITVSEDSEDAWVFMEVTMNYNKGILLAKAVGAEKPTVEYAKVAAAALSDKTFDANAWTIRGYKKDGENITFVASYDTKLSANGKAVLFKKLHIPSNLSNEQMEALNGMKLDFFARAIQASGLADSKAAYDALYAGEGFSPAP
ncbi:MAG: hypothetical protein IIZ48_06935 [Erysipelotrichales bacterium]|nr:hypothetical protein [Erysipelotrichales bacterium]